MCGVDADTFKQIFRDHWDAFKAQCPTFDRPDYNTPVQKMLDCGDPEKMGYVQYRCLFCGETRRIAFTCKSCFCLSCAQPRMAQWSDFIARSWMRTPISSGTCSAMTGTIPSAYMP